MGTIYVHTLVFFLDAYLLSVSVFELVETNINVHTIIKIMLKIKSKAILAFAGLMVAAFVFASAPVASADMVTLPTTGVSKSSSMSNIQALQTFLNWNLGSQIVPLVVDGVYGAKTTAAIKLFQSQNGLVADGIFGRMSAAKAMALQANAGGVVYPAGCSSNTGYSSTTGMPCAGSALPAGCMSTAGYSSTTGVPCSTPVGTSLPAGCASAAGYSSTTGQPCSTTSVNTGTNGYLADITLDSTNRVTKVYESEQNKVVAGFRATARLADQTVTRVRVTMVNSSTGSANLAKYISGATLWYGSQAIATMSVAQADRSTSSDLYTFNFSGLNAKIAKDQIGRFYVSVNANGSIDTNDASGASFTVAFTDGGISASSPDGSSDTYSLTGGNSVSALTFGKFSNSGVKAEVTLSPSNPTANTVAVSSTTTTSNVELLKFRIKAVNSDLTVKKIPVQVTISSTTGADNVEAILNSIKLMQGANVVDTVSGDAGYVFTAGSESTSTSGTACDSTAGHDTCTFYFSNLSAPYNTISAGSTAEYSVVAELKAQSNYAAGSTISASLPNVDVLSSDDFSIQDMNGDQLTDASSTIRVGSAVGETMTLRVNGVNVVMGTTSATRTTNTSGDVTSVTYTIPVAVTAFGNTLYVGQSAQLATTATASNAFSLVAETAAAPNTESTSATTSITLSSSDATIETNGFRLDSGTTKHFTITVTMTAATDNTSIRFRLDQIRTFTEGALVNATNADLLPVTNYRTGYEYINN
jgi:peptidoglycan hydrolase-like protein with peptidoglycan-binding domain